MKLETCNCNRKLSKKNKNQFLNHLLKPINNYKFQEVAQQHRDNFTEVTRVKNISPGTAVLVLCSNRARSVFNTRDNLPGKFAPYSNSKHLLWNLLIAI